MGTGASHTDPVALRALLASVAERARRAGVFSEVAVGERGIACNAAGSAAPATYRLVLDRGVLWVALTTADRWLSQSIEQDLVHTGDKLEDLIEEELVDQGVSGVRLACEHFRDDEKLFTFRSALPSPQRDMTGEEFCARVLLAYEACFRRLGDMEAGEGE